MKAPHHHQQPSPGENQSSVAALAAYDPGRRRKGDGGRGEKNDERSFTTNNSFMYSEQSLTFGLFTFFRPSLFLCSSSSLRRCFASCFRRRSASLLAFFSSFSSSFCCCLISFTSRDVNGCVCVCMCVCACMRAYARVKNMQGG